MLVTDAPQEGRDEREKNKGIIESVQNSNKTPVSSIGQIRQEGHKGGFHQMKQKQDHNNRHRDRKFQQLDHIGSNLKGCRALDYGKADQTIQQGQTRQLKDLFSVASGCLKKILGQ